MRTLVSRGVVERQGPGSMITNCKENKTDMEAYLAGPRNHHQAVLRSASLLGRFSFTLVNAMS
jgi:hypothetical protein